jgi:hypothetical protein
VSELDPPGDVGTQCAEAVDDGIVDGLKGSEAIAHLGHVGPGLVGVMIEEGEHPYPSVVSGPRHSGVGAPADIGCIGDDGAVVEVGTPAPLHPLGCE